MNAIEGYTLVKPDDLDWKVANPMKLLSADLLQGGASEILGARLWRLPPGSANTLHRHVKAEELYFVLEGTGRIRVGGETLTVPLERDGRRNGPTGRVGAAHRRCG